MSQQQQPAQPVVKNEWKSVVAPLPPEGQYEERVKYYLNKLHYKLPVTFRYGVVFAACSGLVSVIRKRSGKRFFGHLLIVTPLCGFGLCYNELLGLGQNYYMAYYKNK
jgi:hypothetical protein